MTSINEMQITYLRNKEQKEFQCLPGDLLPAGWFQMLLDFAKFALPALEYSLECCECSPCCANCKRARQYIHELSDKEL